MEVEEAVAKFLGDEEYSGWERFALNRRTDDPDQSSKTYIRSELDFIGNQLGVEPTIEDNSFLIDQGDHHLQFKARQGIFTDGWKRQIVAISEKPKIEKALEFGNRHQVAIELRPIDIIPVQVKIEPEQELDVEGLEEEAYEKFKEESILGGLDGYRYQFGDIIYDSADLDIGEGEIIVTVESLDQYSEDMLEIFFDYDFEDSAGFGPLDLNKPENWELEFENNGDAIVKNSLGDRIRVNNEGDNYTLEYAPGKSDTFTRVPGKSEFDEFYESVDYVRDTVISGGGWN